MDYEQSSSEGSPRHAGTYTHQHSGHIQSGGVESGNEWTPVMATLTVDEVIFTVNEIEVSRFSRSDIDFVEAGGGVYQLLGAEEALFFHPDSIEVFRLGLAGPQSSADRIKLAASQAPARPPTLPEALTERSRLVAALLAIFVGGFGIHKFYLGQTGMGVVYLVFFWTIIPAIIGFIEGILYLVMSEEEFQRKYG